MSNVCFTFFPPPNILKFEKLAQILALVWMDAYSEDSLRLALGLPVGVMNFPQDHPGLVVSSVLKTHTRAHSKSK